jgi:hypothetical protein
VKRKMVEKIKELKKVVSALIQLALEIGTLLAVIKMIVESLQ